MQSNRRDLQNAVHVFNVALDVGRQVFRRLDSPHIQCGREGAGQSPGDAGDHVVQRGRVFRANDLPSVLLLIEAFDSAVDAEVNGLLEVLDMSRAVRALMFFDTKTASVSDGHDDPFRFVTFITRPNSPLK